MWWLKSFGASAVIAIGFTPLVVAMSASAPSVPVRGQPYVAVAAVACHEEPDAASPVVIIHNAGTMLREDDHLDGWSGVGGCFVEASGIMTA